MGRSSSSVRADASIWRLLGLTKHPCPLSVALRPRRRERSSEMTIHLDITEDVQSLPLWRERVSSRVDPVRVCERSHILAAIQQLNCQR
jgi:hypothetical protein